MLCWDNPACVRSSLIQLTEIAFHMPGVTAIAIRLTPSPAEIKAASPASIVSALPFLNGDHFAPFAEPPRDEERGPTFETRGQPERPGGASATRRGRRPRLPEAGGLSCGAGRAVRVCGQRDVRATGGQNGRRATNDKRQEVVSRRESWPANGENETAKCEWLTSSDFANADN